MHRMKNTDLSNQIKALRITKGYSQDYLATQTQLSLRTIQRIESGETEPRGDTLQRLAACLGVEVTELTSVPQPQLRDDKVYLTAIHLSALSFIVFPLLGILLPFILWIAKGRQIQNISTTARRVLNFQITWCTVFGIYYGFLIGGMFMHFENPISMRAETILLVILGMYGYNIIFIGINAVREYNGKSLFYQPAVPLLR